MTRAEYLVELEAHLARKLPPQRLEHIIDYYREYFDEAGPGREQQIMEELGAPEMLARRVLGESALAEVTGEQPPSGRRGLGTLWTVLLAVCAAPIAIPLILLSVILAVAAAVAVAGVALGIIAGGVACIAVGIFVVICAFSVLFTGGIGATMYFSGLGLLAMGGGVLLILAACALAGVCFKGMARLLGRLLHRKEARA